MSSNNNKALRNNLNSLKKNKNFVSKPRKSVFKFSARPVFRKNKWIDNSITNPECKKYYSAIQIALRRSQKRLGFSKKASIVATYYAMFRSFFRKPVLNNLNFNKNNSLANSYSYSVLINKNKNITPNTFYYSRNTNIVNVEFYHLWFCKATLGDFFNRNILFGKTTEGWGASFWKTFRKARYDIDARRLRDMLKLDWTTALYCKTIGTLGPHRFKFLKSLKVKALKRLKKAKYYLELAINTFKSGLRLRLLFGKNYVKKKYTPQRRHWKFSKKLSNLYFLTAKTNIFYYKLLKRTYLKHITRYNFVYQPTRLISYFNILSSLGTDNNQIKLSIPSWINYFNLTKRRTKNLFALLRKRQWSAEHNINISAMTDLSNVLRTVPIRLLKNRILDIFDYTDKTDILIKDYKPIVVYKKFNNEIIQNYFKSRLNNKFFVKAQNAQWTLRKLTERIQRFKRHIAQEYPLVVNNFLNTLLSKHPNLLKKDLVNLLSLFKYKHSTDSFVFTPTVLYTAPPHLRMLEKTNYWGLVINITQKNYFFTVVKVNTGEVKKVFSSGYSRAKTTRLRRSPMMFTKVFNLLLDYLKSKNINKLKFVRITQPSLVPKNISFEDQKKVNWYPNQFKYAKIRVRRWIYELRRVHGLPLRGPKLRRK